MPTTFTHPFLSNLNTYLKAAGGYYDAHSPERLAIRLADDPDYLTHSPYSHLTYGHQFTDSVTVACPDSYIAQLYAAWGTRDSGIFRLTITKFYGPPHEGVRAELYRMVLELVEGEDALDNDQYNNYGRIWDVLLVELPLDDDLIWDYCLSILATYLPNFKSEAYITH